MLQKITSYISIICNSIQIRISYMLIISLNRYHYLSDSMINSDLRVSVRKGSWAILISQQLPQDTESIS
jgi:hypothetical protein